MSDPVSWLVIEKGWTVVAADSREVGRVDEVIGDTSNDIFNGLAVSPGLLRASRYVPAERVGPITEGYVQVELTAEEFDRLDDWHGTPHTADSG